MDSCASKCVVSHKMDRSLPKLIPPLQKTSMKFTVPNGGTIRANGVVHLPIVMKFEHSTRTCMLPVFVCHLAPSIDCIFGLELGIVLHFETGVLWHDDVNGIPINDSLHCTPSPRSFRTVSVETTVLKANNYGLIKVSSHSNMPPKEWC